jgi:hypothetical protein
MNHHDRLTDRDRIRVYAQIKHELKTEAIDILIDALHQQMRGGGTVSFDHNLVARIEKLIISDMPRAKIIALVRTGIYTVISLRSIDETPSRYVDISFGRSNSRACRSPSHH